MDKELVDKAKDFAQQAHGTQLDDEGKSYFLAHVCQVARLVSSVTEDTDIIAAAYLHDTIEDCGVTEQLLKTLFNDRIASLVWEVTHEGDKTHGYYFPRLVSKDAIIIKFADRLSNLSRMNCWDAERQNHYLKKSKFWKESW